MPFKFLSWQRYMVVGLALLLSACSTQPEWLQRKRHYHGWEHSTRQVNAYNFDWVINGAAEAAPLQVFSASDEIWVQWPQTRPVPVIIAVDERGRSQVLSVHEQPPYLVVKGSWPVLRFHVRGQQAEARFGRVP